MSIKQLFAVLVALSMTVATAAEEPDCLKKRLLPKTVEILIPLCHIQQNVPPRLVFIVGRRAVFIARNCGVDASDQRCRVLESLIFSKNEAK